jgi:hypothetical protein
MGDATPTPTPVAEGERAVPRMPRPTPAAKAAAKPRPRVGGKFVRADQVETKPKRRKRRAKRKYKRRVAATSFMDTINELTALVKLARLLRR